MNIVIPAHTTDEISSTWNSIFPGISTATADAPVTYVSTVDASLKVELYLVIGSNKETLFFKLYANNQPVSTGFNGIERSAYLVNNVRTFSAWTVLEELSVLECHILVMQPESYGQAAGGGVIATDGTNYFGYSRGQGSSSTTYGGLYSESAGGYESYTLQPAQYSTSITKPDGSTNYLISKKYRAINGEWVEFPLSVNTTYDKPYVLSDQNYYMANKGLAHIEIVR